VVADVAVAVFVVVGGSACSSHLLSPFPDPRAIWCDPGPLPSIAVRVSVMPLRKGERPREPHEKRRLRKKTWMSELQDAA
jgi:hypothetical protein